MAADDAGKEGATWPMPKFRFEVDLAPDLTGVAFQEVTGMDVENQVMEYRKGNSPLFSVQKMPGIAKYGNVTLKKGVFINDHSFWNWHKEMSVNTVKKRTVLIKLLDESGSVTMQWQLDNAWPVKITGTDINSGSNDVAVDTIEMAHEQITITNRM